MKKASGIILSGFSWRRLLLVSVIPALVVIGIAGTTHAPVQAQEPVNDPRLLIEAIGGSGLDVGSSLTQTSPDGNFVITGGWDYSGEVESDLFLIKVDGSGAPMWGKALKGSPDRYETGTSVIETSEGFTRDLVVVGHSNSFASDFNAIIARTDPDVTQLKWAKRIVSVPAGAPSFALSMTETHDSSGAVDGFVMTGPIWDHPAGGSNMDVFIAKFNGDGSWGWGTVLVGGGDDCGTSVIEASNRDLVVTGWTTSFGSMDLLLARFDSNGGLKWATAYGGAASEHGESVVEADGDLFVTGATDSSDGQGGDDLLLVKFPDGDGSPTPDWAKTLGGADDDYGLSMVLTHCGGSETGGTPPCEDGLAITGVTKSFGQGGQDVLLTMFDLDGSRKWTRTLDAADPGTGNDVGVSVINACAQGFLYGLPVWINCGLAFTGYTTSWGMVGEDVLFGTSDYYGYGACEKIAPAVVGTTTVPPIASFLTTINQLDAIPITPVIASVTPAVESVCDTDFTQITDVGPPDQPVVFSFLIITDNHIRVSGSPMDQLITVVDRINAYITAGNKDDVRFVLVLGDIGDEGYRDVASQKYVDVKHHLARLKVPYVPLIGNHDVWYDDPEDLPLVRPEEAFHQAFEPQYDHLRDVVLPGWTKAAPVWDDPPSAGGTNVWNYFQNFAFDYMRYHFISLDWVSRDDIYTSNFSDSNVKRGCPDLQQWATGGTWDWLFTTHLPNYANMGDENLLLFAHHPLSFTATTAGTGGCNTPLLDPKNIYAFSAGRYSDIVGAIHPSYSSSVDKWFAGHWHACDDGWWGDWIPVAPIGPLCCEEEVTDDANANIGSPVLTSIDTRSVSSFPIKPGENIRLVRVHDDLKAEFTYLPPRPLAPATVTFTDASGGHVASQNDWDLVVGTWYGGTPPPTMYNMPGIYKVTLTVTDGTEKASIAHAIDVGTYNPTSEYPDATAYNNARKLIFDPQHGPNGTLHLAYTTGPGPGMLTYAQSTDEGDTWFEVTPELLWGGHPALDVDTSGKACVVENWAGIGSGFDAKRREKPLGWFSYDGVSDLSAAFGYPSMVVDSQDTLHIAISYDDGITSRIRYYTASPGGRISDPEEVPRGTGPGDCSFASIALDNNETPHVIWQQGSNMYHSHNTGAWTTPEEISSVTATASAPSIVADGSNLYAVWQEDGQVMYSIYDGTNWLTTPEVVATLSPGASAYPQVVNRRHVVWQDLDSDGTYDIFRSKRIAARGWLPPRNVSDTSDNSRYPQAAMANNDLHVVWTEETPYEIRHEKIAAPVGGVVELLVEGSDSSLRPVEGPGSSAPYAAIAGAAAAAALAIAAGGWYARRRWLR